jgi:hypothetical protein
VPSAIVNAAQSGQLLILDGLDRLPPSTVSILASLVEDRSLVTYLFLKTNFSFWFFFLQNAFLYIIS